MTSNLKSVSRIKVLVYKHKVISGKPISQLLKSIQPCQPFSEHDQLQYQPTVPIYS